MKYVCCDFLSRNDPWNISTVTSCGEITHEIWVLWLLLVQKSPVKYQYCDFILPVQKSPMKYRHCDFILPVQKTSQVRQLESSMSSKESSLQSSIREWQSRAESAEKHVSGYTHLPTSCRCAVWTLLPHLNVVFCNVKTTAFFLPIYRAVNHQRINWVLFFGLLFV